MKVYLAKFTLNNKSMYKIGHTKFFHSIKRFQDAQYDAFDHVEILDDIYLEHRDPRTARMMAELVEASLKAYFPKNFMLEEYFHKEEGTFDNLSGITECFVINGATTESDVVEIFSRVKKQVGFVIHASNKHS